MPADGTGRAQLTLFAMTFLYAVSVTMIGPLMPLIISTFDLRLSLAGLLVSFQQLGGALAIIGSALFADRAHKPLLIALAFSVYSLGLFSIAAAPGYAVLAAAFLAVGSGSRFFDTVANADTAEWNPGRSALYLSLLHTVFAVGALTGPLYVSILVQAGASWSTIFVGLGAAAAVAVAVYVTRPRFRNRRSVASTTLRPGSVVDVVRAPRMWIACAVMLSYTAHQAGFSVWLPMYLQTSLLASPHLGAMALSFYWLGIIIGRLLSARLAVIITIKRQLWAGALIGTLVLLAAFSARDPLLLTGAALLAGIAGAGVIPNLVTLCCSWFPANTATASSMLFLSASIGHMISPWLIASVTERSSFDIGFLIPILALAVTAALATGLPQPERSVS